MGHPPRSAALLQGLLSSVSPSSVASAAFRGGPELLLLLLRWAVCSATCPGRMLGLGVLPSRAARGSRGRQAGGGGKALDQSPQGRGWGADSEEEAQEGEGHRPIVWDGTELAELWLVPRWAWI